MKRTKGLVPLLEVERKERATNSGMTTFREDINDFMIPILKKHGYDGKLIPASDVNKKQKKSIREENQKMNSKDSRELLLHKGAGWFLEIWPKGRIKPKLIVKPFVRDSTKQVLGIPRVNLSSSLMAKFMPTAGPAAKIKAITFKLFTLDMHFLIMTRTGQFWLDKFSNIKDHEYRLEWRKNKEIFDRLATGKTGNFHSIKKELTFEIKETMRNFNKNNRYDR